MSTFMNTLLFATDFSQESIKAAKVARGLADLAQAKLYVANVVALLQHSHSWSALTLASRVNVEEVDRELISRCRQQLQDFIDQHLSPGPGDHFTIEPMVFSGASIPNVIIGQSMALGVKTIILATHGRSGIDRALAGSVAEHVVRASPIPVLTVHG